MFYRCTRVHSVVQSFPAIRISICRLSMSYTSKTWVQMVSTLSYRRLFYRDIQEVHVFFLFGSRLRNRINFILYPMKATVGFGFDNIRTVFKLPGRTCTCSIIIINCAMTTCLWRPLNWNIEHLPTAKRIFSIKHGILIQS